MKIISASKLEFVTLIIISAILSLLFYFYPQIDISCSSLFFKEGEGFPLKSNKLVKILASSAFLFTSIFCCIVFTLFIKEFVNKRSLNPLKYKIALFLSLALLIGPLFLVKGAVKHFFDRARPYQIEEFEGPFKFTPAFVPGHECRHDCSFSSFHSSLGFLFVAFTFLFTEKKKRFYLTLLSIILGLTFGSMRIMQGKHFLSDVICSGIFVFLISYILSHIFSRSNDVGTKN